MPVKFFLCPDNIERPITTCLEKCPRPEGRCLSLPTLYTIGESYEWKGKPSTTQLISPTRIEYLKILCDYSINPLDSAFMLLGTRVHKQLDIVAKKLEMMSEKFVPDNETNSILDLLEPENGSDKYLLIDYKCWGSYAVAKALGLKTHDSDPEISDTTYQLNHYRMKVEKIGFPISRLIVQAIIRDGGTFTARNNGIDQKFVMIQINRLENKAVTEYFELKSEALLCALAGKRLPPMCNYSESWANRRCKGYCNVFAWCPEGAQINRVPLKEKNKWNTMNL